jgi:CubicO group peptidase (beta-lactamase class C family)
MTDKTWAAALQMLTPIFRAHCDEHHVPGCAFGVVAGGQVVCLGGIGELNPGSGVQAGPSGVYRIASMTKCFAALAILMLRDEGKLSLDRPAADYVSELRSLVLPTRDSAPITVRQLLTMSGGWPEDNPWGDRQLWRTNEQLDELLQGGISFSTPPGVAFEYSNYAYMVLGRIISHVSGKSSLDFITQRILLPLGMNDTVWNAGDVDPQRLAKGYHWLYGAWVEEPMLPSGGDSAAFGGLYSSVLDLARWVNFQLWAWPPRDEEEGAIVRRSTLREMQQPHRLYRPSGEAPELCRPVTWSAGGYGFGLSISHQGDLTIVGHAGGLPGFGSHMCWIPDYDLGVIALGNVRYATMREAATKAILQLVQQGYAQPRPVRGAPTLHAACASVNRLVATWDDELAERLFADNFFLDNSREWWRAELEGLVAKHGNLRMIGELEPQNALRGKWMLAGDRGWVEGYLTLTPTVPPQIQELSLNSVLPPGPAILHVLEELGKVLARPTQRGVRALFATQTHLPLTAHSFFDQVRLVSVLCGPCRLNKVLAGDGESFVRVRIEGEKADVEAALTLDEERKKIAKAVFRQVR